MPESADLSTAVADLDDEYLKVMLLLAVRRARSEEPRRAGFWHAVAVTLAEEQEKRRSAAHLSAGEATPVGPAEGPELKAVLEQLRAEVATLESELRESVGDVQAAGTQPQ